MRRRLRVVRGIGVVFRHFRDHSAADERQQIRLQRVGFRLGVNLFAFDIKGEGF